MDILELALLLNTLSMSLISFLTVQNVSRDLLGELNTFCDMTTEQNERFDVSVILLGALDCIPFPLSSHVTWPL